MSYICLLSADCSLRPFSDHLKFLRFAFPNQLLYNHETIMLQNVSLLLLNIKSGINQLHHTVNIPNRTFSMRVVFSVTQLLTFQQPLTSRFINNSAVLDTPGKHRAWTFTFIWLPLLRFALFLSKRKLTKNKKQELCSSLDQDLHRNQSPSTEFTKKYLSSNITAVLRIILARCLTMGFSFLQP